jgi:hypothetical protein
VGKRKVNKIENGRLSFWVQTVALFWAFFAVRAVWFAIGRFNIGYQVLNPAVENLAEVVQLGRGNALPLADAVNGAAADVVVVDQRISAFPTPLHRFPEFVVYNHLIT